MEVLPISNVDYNNQEAWSYDSDPFEDDEGECAKTINALTARLVEELRNAKRDHFSSGEVLMPAGLLQRISRDVLAAAEREPCGLRGCTLYLHFKGEEAAREITLGTVKFDRATASTFELTLLLKQSSAGWNSFLPQFLKKMTRRTVMIDSDYKLQKNKLYRSYSD